MPEYLYRCRDCGNEITHSQSIYDYLDPVLEEYCCLGMEEMTKHDKVIEKPGIGYIQGAGGSPNR